MASANATTASAVDENDHSDMLNLLTDTLDEGCERKVYRNVDEHPVRSGIPRQR